MLDQEADYPKLIRECEDDPERAEYMQHCDRRIMQLIGSAVRKLREERNLHTEDVAVYLGVRRQVIESIEWGKQGQTIFRLMSLATLFGQPENYFFKLAEKSYLPGLDTVDPFEKLVGEKK